MCYKNNHWVQCVATDLDGCDIKWSHNSHTIILKPADTDTFNGQAFLWTTLSVVKQQLLQSVINQIGIYFPEGSLNIFEVLNPAMLPTANSEVPQFSESIKSLAVRFQIHRNLVVDQFSRLLTKLIIDFEDQYCSMKEGHIIEFWTHFLNHKQLQWEPELKKLLHIVLIIPVGTADVERGFSILNEFLTKRRNRLTNKHVEDITRIRINGPAIQDFKPLPYTLH